MICIKIARPAIASRREKSRRASRPFVIIVSLVLLNGTSSAAQEKLPSLAEVLAKAAAYCRVLESAALDFVCEEEIVEHVAVEQRRISLPLEEFDPTRVLARRAVYRRNAFRYDYQLIRLGDRIEEKRDFVEENGRRRDEKNARLKTELFAHKFIMFGPVGLLSCSSQDAFDYDLAGIESFGGEKAFVVEAQPKTKETPSRLFGKVWIKPDDGSVLKIEWDQASLGNFVKILAYAKAHQANPQVMFRSEYGIANKVLRFPSRYDIQENYLLKNGTTLFNRSKTHVAYRNYRFFTVETNVEFKAGL